MLKSTPILEEFLWQWKTDISNILPRVGSRRVSSSRISPLWLAIPLSVQCCAVLCCTVLCAVLCCAVMRCAVQCVVSVVCCRGGGGGKKEEWRYARKPSTPHSGCGEIWTSSKTSNIIETNETPGKQQTRNESHLHTFDNFGFYSRKGCLRYVMQICPV